jgi:adenylate cyclase
MAADEQATVAALDAARAVFRKHTKSNQGRVIDMAGDSVLAVFELATSAVSAAVAIQNELGAAAKAVPDDQRMHFRIGVHLGEIIEKPDGTVYGDGVNIAARLQGLAAPGAVTISESVRAAVRGKLDAEFEDQGEQVVKNITEPIRVFSVGSPAQHDEAQMRSRRDAQRPAQSQESKPSIAVLPFNVFGAGGDQMYLADGIVEDITTELSKLRWFHVIARNTSFMYKAEAIDIRKVARELGVRYVLEGSVRSMGGRVRITAQLNDASTGRHIWAERFDSEINKIFDVQDEIVSRVVGAVGPELYSAEIRRSRERGEKNLEVWDYAMRGRWHVTRITKEDNDIARPLLEKALQLDPNSVPALASLAYCHVTALFFGWTKSPGETIAEARRAAEKALSLDQSDPWAQVAVGLAEFVAKQTDKATGHFKQALDLNPNFALAYGYYALALAYGGEPERAIEAGRRAILLSPRDPELVHFYAAIATAHFVRGDYAAAVEWAEKTALVRPVPAAYRPLAIGNAFLGRAGDARTAIDELLRRVPDATVSGVKNTIHFKIPAHADCYIDGLRKAGLPE